MRYLIMCRSLTYAQRAAKALEKNGITVGIIKAPVNLTGGGCSYALSVPLSKGTRALDILKKEKQQYGKVFIQKADGSVEGVSL